MLENRTANRRMRWVAAWAVAYILVFQAFLSSVAIAALPIAAGSTLCIGSGASNGDGDHSDTGSAAQVHCQACLARADIPDLTPPFQVPTIDRVAIELRFDRLVRTALRRFEFQYSFQPRGPPSILPS